MHKTLEYSAILTFLLCSLGVVETRFSHMERKQETEVQWFCKRKTGKKRIICIHLCMDMPYTLHYTTLHHTTYTHYTCMHVWKGKRRQFSWFLLHSSVLYIYDEEEKDTWFLMYCTTHSACRFLSFHSDAIWPSHLRTYYDKRTRPLVEFAIKYGVLWVAHSGFFLSFAFCSRFVLIEYMY